MISFEETIVIDNGTETIKAGSAGQETPTSIFPSNLSVFNFIIL